VPAVLPSTTRNTSPARLARTTRQSFDASSSSTHHPPPTARGIRPCGHELAPPRRQQRRQRVEMRLQHRPAVMQRGPEAGQHHVPRLPEQTQFAIGQLHPVAELSVCADSWATEYHSNAHLKPERSRQMSFGTVLQPTKSTSLSVDYWNIRKRNLSSNLGQDVILANPEKYADLITRDPDEGYITNIVMTLDNRGEERSSGIDVVFDAKKIPTPTGAFSAHVSGTWMLESKVQTGNGEPFVSNLGKFVEEKVVQRWRHRVSVDWDNGPFSVTLGNTWCASYEDHNSAIDTNDGSVVTANHVKAYSLWDLSGSVDITPKARLRAGVQNLFDTHPPFSNQAYYFISGYDLSYTDPRSRVFYASVNLSF
jgi:iron complex outermembrane receptor protein